MARRRKPHVVVQAFTILWFVAVGIFSAFSLWLGASLPPKEGAPHWVGWLVGVCMAVAALLFGLLGFHLVRFSKRLALSDVSEICSHVTDLLETSSAQGAVEASASFPEVSGDCTGGAPIAFTNHGQRGETE